MNRKIYNTLTKLGACDEGIAFAVKFETPQQAWENCEEPTWMVWVIRRRMKCTKVKWVKLGVFCAEQTLPVFEKHYSADMRPRNAIKTAKAWIKSPTGVALRLTAFLTGNRANAAASDVLAYHRCSAAAASSACRAAAHAAFAVHYYDDVYYSVSAAVDYAVAASPKTKRIICDYIRKHFKFTHVLRS